LKKFCLNLQLSSKIRRLEQIRFCLNLQLSRDVISNLSIQSNFSLRRMKIDESSLMIMLIIYYLQQSRIILIVHSLCCEKKETLDASTNDMTSFFIFCTSQSIISIAYNSSFSLHIKLELFDTKKHHSIILRCDMLVNSLNEILQWLKRLFVCWRE
jgi:hypothetical protein